VLPARLWVQFALLANLWVQSLLHVDFRWAKNQKLRKLSAARLRVHFGRVMGFVTSLRRGNSVESEAAVTIAHKDEAVLVAR